MSWIPAIRGGEPAFPEGPPSWPSPDAEVLAALQRAYADGSWGRYDGPNLRALVEAFEQLVGVPHVLPCSSGTIATELALRGLGVAAGDEVILGAYDFPGNFRSIEAIGATPVVVDLDRSSRAIDLEQVAVAYGPATKAVIATHLHGSLVDMPKLRAIADRRGFAIVEDACQSPGATIAGKPAGSWGDVGTFSFGGSKTLTAGRGGAVVTARADVAQRIKVFNERGNAALPLSELQAAVLVPQIAKLATCSAARQRGARRMIAALAGASELAAAPTVATAMTSLGEDRPDFYKLGFTLELDVECGGKAVADASDSQLRDAFAAAARAEGIALDPGFRGFVRRGSRRCRQVGECPTARRVVDRILVLHHPILACDDAQIDRTATTLARLAAAFRDGSLTAADIPTALKFDGR